jgi:hypothetical protein
MTVDLFTPLFAMCMRCAFVLGFMLFIVALGRDAWRGFGKHE